MRKFLLILQVLVGTTLFSLLLSCREEGINHDWDPVDLEIMGATVDDHNHFDYKVTIPPSGGDIIVKGYGKRGDESYIRSIKEITPNKHFFMVDWNSVPPYFGSDSWLKGEWWSITYTKETPPYEMVIIIQPNPSDQERVLELDYGSGAYVLSHVTLTQKGK